MKTIQTEPLRQRLESGTVALFDVRGDVDFEGGHIPGAMSAPLGSLISRVRRLMNADSFVAVYSNGAGCDLAVNAAERLEDLGMRNVHCYDEGLAGWETARLPVVPSTAPKPNTRGLARESRSLVVNRHQAYGGAFAHRPADTTTGGG